MKVRILSLVVVAVLLVLTTAPALANERTAEQKALAAQGLAWRLLINENGALNSVPSSALENWQKGQTYLSQGIWSQAQSSFETASGSLIRHQVAEAWLLKGQPIPDYIFSEASLGVVERGWTLKSLALRIVWATSPRVAVFGADGKEEYTSFWPGGTIVREQSTRQFSPQSRVVIHLDPRYLMRNLYIELSVYVRKDGSYMEQQTVVTAPVTVFWISNSDGYKVHVRTIAFNAKGEIVVFGDWRDVFLPPIGPGSVVEVTLP